jgi:hypothetical protein
MTRRIQILLAGAALGLAFTVGGCVVHTGVRAHAYVEEPNLVYVSPGVWVVENHHESVFFYDHYYWSYRGGYWYRSSVYNGSWVRVHVVPRRVRGIRYPTRYVRYRAPRGVRTRRAPAPRVRDHRARPGYNRAPARRGNERVPARRARPAGHRHQPAAAPPRGGRGYPKASRSHRGHGPKAKPPRRSHKSKAKSKSKSKKKKKSRSRDHR